MNEPVLLKCGHAANSVKKLPDGTEIPFCVICMCGDEQVSKPDLTERKSKCPFCKKIVDSDYNLAFFQHRPEEEYDEHYDGCFGWD